MTRRKPSDIIRGIIHVLTEKPLSLRALETKMNTNDRTIRNYTQLLKDLNLLSLKKIQKGKKVITCVELKPTAKKLKV